MIARKKLVFEKIRLDFCFCPVLGDRDFEKNIFYAVTPNINEFSIPVVNTSLYFLKY